MPASALAPFGNSTVGTSGVVQLAPKSSLWFSTEPQCMLLAAAQSRCLPARLSYARAYTECPGKCGPPISNRARSGPERKRKAPFMVPTRTTTSPRRTWICWVVGMGQSLSEPQAARSEEHTSELQSLAYLVCRLLLEKKKRSEYEFWIR